MNCGSSTFSTADAVANNCRFSSGSVIAVFVYGFIADKSGLAAVPFEASLKKTDKNQFMD
jgi:hypothetical protein